VEAGPELSGEQSSGEYIDRTTAWWRQAQSFQEDRSLGEYSREPTAWWRQAQSYQEDSLQVSRHLWAYYLV
jgi:hypothetical protein